MSTLKALRTKLENIASRATPAPWEHESFSMLARVSPRKTQSMWRQDPGFTNENGTWFPGDDVARFDDYELVALLRNNLPLMLTVMEAYEAIRAGRHEEAKSLGREIDELVLATQEAR